MCGCLDDGQQGIQGKIVHSESDALKLKVEEFEGKRNNLTQEVENILKEKQSLLSGKASNL